MMSHLGKARLRLGKLIKRYPLVLFATVLAIILVAASLAFANRVQHSTASSPGFDTSRVLPLPVAPQVAKNTVYTAETIKQYDGKNGHKCYAAVNGIVYMIPQTGQWQGGQHLPSNGEAYCGADLSQAIKHSPHGVTKLQELPQVGIFK